MKLKDTTLDDIADTISALVTHIDMCFERMDARFDAIEERLGSLEGRVTGLERAQRDTNERLGRLEAQAAT